MKIKPANSDDVIKSLSIAKNLKEWFTNVALKKMENDFKNNMIVVFDVDLVGFLNYRIDADFVRILWMGVDKECRRKGAGEKLLEELEDIAKKNNVNRIVVNTLSQNDDHEPYVSTRNFYLKNSFTYGDILPRKKDEDEQFEMEKIL